ncbi:PEGA domain-containing protein [Candidatus Saccharibacteria bacterium CPR2]|nr:PEGA domain-containing protein [Candidatus Saccharibacteria bacterium CPR2]
MFIDFQSERVRSTIRLLLYALGGALAAIATIFIVFAAKGYDIDRNTGTLIQNGLILVDAGPKPAQIFINDKAENDTTPGKLALPAGEYKLELKRDGYRSWSKNVELKGEEVMWVYYPKLFPEQILAATQFTYPKVNDASQSLDKFWLLVRNSSDKPIYDQIEVDKIERPIKNVVLPEEVFTKKDGKLGDLKIIEWAQDNKVILLNHKNGDINEFIVFDRTKPETSRNISREFGLPLDNIQFLGGSNNQLYALVDKSLRLIDLDKKTISSSLMEHVLYYRVYGDKAVLLIHELKDSGTIRASILKDGKTMEIRDVAPNEKYFMRMEKYDGDEYLAITDSPTNMTYIYKNPFDTKEGEKPKPFRTISSEKPQMASFSNNSQFVSLQNGSKFTVYDIEYDKTYQFAVDRPLAENVLAEWMDGHRLMLQDQSNKLLIFEFDGANLVEIVPIDPRFDVFFDHDFENIYTVAPPASATETIIQRVNLVVEKQ